MKLSFKVLVREGLKLVFMMVACLVIVDTTQTAAMVILAALHEAGHAIMGIMTGEHLVGVSVTAYFPYPMGIGGLTTFTENGTYMRAVAGPIVTVLIGALLAIMFVADANTRSIASRWLKGRRCAGFIVEALILLLFWSGYSIALQLYNKSSGSDLGSVVASSIGQIYFYPLGLAGLLIMTFLLVKRVTVLMDKSRALKYQEKAAKNIGLMLYLVLSALNVFLLLIVPVEIAVTMWGLVFMIITAVYYFALLMDDRVNVVKVGKDLYRNGLWGPIV
jgi:hypothetical protein